MQEGFLLHDPWEVSTMELSWNQMLNSFQDSQWLGILTRIFKICVNYFWLIGSILIYNYCSFTLYCAITYTCSVCFVSGSPPSQPLKPLITVYDKGSVDPDSIHCPTPQKCVSKCKNVGQKVSRRKNPFSIYVDDNGLCFILHSKIWLLWEKLCKSWFISHALTPYFNINLLTPRSNL